MIHSLQTKILLWIGVIFILTTTSIIYFTQKDVKNAVLSTEQKNIENIKNIILLNVEGKYKNLLIDKLDYIKITKKQIKDQGRILSQGLNSLCPMNSGEDENRDRIKAVEWLNSLDISSAVFLADQSNEVFFHSNGILKNKNLGHLRDAKSRPVSAGINNKSTLLDKYVVFSCENAESKKLCYLTRLSKWGWALGITNDISSIEAEAENKINEIIRVLGENFKQIKIAGTGTIFLFDRSGKILIPPSDEFFSAISKDVITILKKSLCDDLPSNLVLNKREVNAYTSHIKALDWYLSALVPVEEIREPANRLAVRLSEIIGGIFLVGFIVLGVAVRRFSHPLKSLAGKLKDIPDKDLTAPEFALNLKKDFYMNRKDEVGALAGSFVYMFQELQKNINRLLVTTAAKERIESELSVARDIQLGILPKIFPPYPEREEFELHAYLEPAREVGGDLYDFFFVDKDHLCISIGDVSGKGVPAALFMAITKTLIKTHSEIETTPSGIMTKMNDVLSRDNPNCMFVTLFIGILNINTGEMKYANAGHNPPLIKSGDRTFFQKGLSGPVAGAMESIQFKELSVNLKKGDILLLYTDGVTEAMNSQKELYSDERLLRLFELSEEEHPKDVIKIVNNDLKLFSEDEPQSDDITMLSLVFNGPRILSETSVK